MVVMFLPTFSYAQIADTEIREQALMLASKIKSDRFIVGDQPNHEPKIGDDSYLRIQRKKLTEAIFDGLSTEDVEALKGYTAAVSRSGHGKDKNIEKLFQKLLIDEEKSDIFKSREEIKELSLGYLAVSYTHLTLPTKA